MYYLGVCSEEGKRVDETESFEYALKEIRNSKEVQADYVRCHGEEFDETKLNDEETKREFVEWFFSGCWIEMEDEEEEVEDEYDYEEWE